MLAGSILIIDGIQFKATTRDMQLNVAIKRSSRPEPEIRASRSAPIHDDGANPLLLLLEFAEARQLRICHLHHGQSMLLSFFFFFKKKAHSLY